MANEATMKKNRRNIMTSIIGMTMISGSSTCLRREMLTRLRMDTVLYSNLPLR